MISATGICFVVVGSSYNSPPSTPIPPNVISLNMLIVILIALIPLELALVLGRAPKALVGEINVTQYAKATYMIIGFGVFALLYAFADLGRLLRFFPKLVLLSQIGLPTLFLTLYPARLLLPDGTLTKYNTTGWLRVLILTLIMWGILDVIHRYRRYSAPTNDRSRLWSPVALFALLAALKVGNTFSPWINPDDFHFGEHLLGWWSYLQGTVPYVGYVPLQGLIDDDLTGFLSYLFYDGSGGSIEDARRLSFALLACAAFLSIYLFSGSIGLAFVSTIFLGWRLSWLFLAPFLCLWFSPSLTARPARWLSAWMLTAPIVVLGVPQGLLLVAASVVIAAHFTWRLLRNPEERAWQEIGTSATVLGVVAVLTPLVPMLFGAIRYVVENGQINQIAYGIPWSRSWNIGAKRGFVFEIIRMSWVAIPITCLAVLYARIKDRTISQNILLPTIAILLFVLLLIPYSMGRIDPGDVSRSGQTSILGWTILLQIIAWRLLIPSNRIVLILLVACASASFGLTTLSASQFVFAASSNITAGPLTNGHNVGMPNIGMAYIQDEHRDRLMRLNALLSAKLAPNETYLDLTSRSAQYFYLNRQPPMAVVAPYNMVSLLQQKRAVEQLSANLPRIALLEATNIIHDGGGIALRNPYLYRFIIDHYSPQFEAGFIIGYRKTEEVNNQEPTIDLAIKDLTDSNWDRGIHRREPALIVADAALMPLLTVGTQVRIVPTEVRRINRVWKEGTAIWLDGSAFDSKPDPSRIQVIVSPEIETEYRQSLFEKAFAQSDFAKIPVAWGRSKGSLQGKMTKVRGFDGVTPKLYALVSENGGYKVTGNDPQLVFDISRFNLSGREAGLLMFDFGCMAKTAEPKIQIFWWGDDRGGPSEPFSIKFTADDGSLIVPVDASPRWLTMKYIKGIRIDLDNASACGAFSVSNLGLFQRYAAEH
jgi:hypothetical protein